MKQKSLFLLISLFAIWSLSAQDLIETTIKGLKKKEQSKTNLIAESVMQNSSFESSSLFTYEGNDLDLDDEKYLDQIIRIKLDLSSLKSLEKKKSNTLRLSIPVSKSQNFHLLMEKVDILEPDYFMETSDGRIIYPDLNKIMFYRGIVEGNSNSQVSLTIIDKEVKLFISDDDGNYSLNRDTKRTNTWNLYNENKLKNKSVFKCGSHGGMRRNESINQGKENHTKMMKNVPVYIEVDNDIYVAKGSNSTNVQTHVMALMNATVTAYTNEQINVSLGSTFIWTTPSTYRKADAGFTLEDFGERIKDNYTGRLAHFITAAFQNGTTGIAWTDVLCDTYNTFMGDLGDGQGNILHHAGPYGLTGDINVNGNPSFANNSQEILTFVHELGHNFGSEHTHGCVWGPNNNQKIDGCAPDEGNNAPCGIVGGATPTQENNTIMSYCQGAALTQGFGTEPGALIRNRYNNAMCINATTPTNDGYTCANAIELTAPGTFNAPGPSQGNGAIAGSGLVHANWYRFTPPMSGMIRIFTCGLTGAGNQHNHVYTINTTSCATLDLNDVVFTEDRGCTNMQADGVKLEDVPVTAGVPIYIEWDDALSTTPFTWTLEYQTGGSTCTDYASTDIPKTISITAETITSTVTVATSGTITDVNIKNLNGTHSWAEDLTFTLMSPQGTSVVLIQNICDSDDTGFNINLDDAATNTLSCPLSEGNTQKPFNLLSNLNGENPMGDWILSVIDRSDDDGGSLEGWTLEICTSGGGGNCPPTLAVDAAGIATNSYQASIQLTSMGTINAASNVIFRAGNNVELRQNFQIWPQGSLVVNIAACQ